MNSAKQAIRVAAEIALFAHVRLTMRFFDVTGR
jgi:hypothetical protein